MSWLKCWSRAVCLTWTLCLNPSNYFPLVTENKYLFSYLVTSSLSGSPLYLVLNVFLVTAYVSPPFLVIDILTSTLSSGNFFVCRRCFGSCLDMKGKAICLEAVFALQSDCFYLNRMFILDGLRVIIEILKEGSFNYSLAVLLDSRLIIKRNCFLTQLCVFSFAYELQ